MANLVQRQIAVTLLLHEGSAGDGLEVAMSDTPSVELHSFPEATSLPLLVYRGALPWLGAATASDCEALFARHGWPGAWHNGIYGFHHFHATTPEVLGIVAGHATVRFGGPAGAAVTVAAGDVVLVPAGVSHCKEAGSADLLVIGAYPGGRDPDMARGTPADHKEAPRQIAAVAVPDSDPVLGKDGPLLRHWRG